MYFINYTSFTMTNRGKYNKAIVVDVIVVPNKQETTDNFSYSIYSNILAH